jgi:hypothetical protein
MTQLLLICALYVIKSSMSFLLTPLSKNIESKPLMFLPDDYDDKWEKRFKHLQNKWNEKPFTLNDENSYLQSVESDVPDKYCANCKFFRNNKGGDDEDENLATCNAFPIQYMSVDSNKDRDYLTSEYYCTIARYFECMCGTSGKRYIEK